MYTPIGCQVWNGFPSLLGSLNLTHPRMQWRRTLSLCYFLGDHSGILGDYNPTRDGSWRAVRAEALQLREAANVRYVPGYDGPGGDGDHVVVTIPRRRQTFFPIRTVIARLNACRIRKIPSCSSGILQLAGTRSTMFGSRSCSTLLSTKSAPKDR